MKPENGELEEEAKESVSDRLIPKRSIVHFLCVIARWSQSRPLGQADEAYASGRI